MKTTGVTIKSMNVILNKFNIFFAIMTFFALVLVVLLGLNYSFDMEMNKDGIIAGCVFTYKTTVCKMNIIEHISLWQNIFVAISQETVPPFSMTIFLTAIWIADSRFPFLADGKTLLEWRLYLARNIKLPIFDPLKRAFSKGILNPKIYDFANL